MKRELTEQKDFLFYYSELLDCYVVTYRSTATGREWAKRYKENEIKNSLLTKTPTRRALNALKRDVKDNDELCTILQTLDKFINDKKTELNA